MATYGKYDQEKIDDIVTSVDRELGDSWNYGSDDLSYLRREYIERFFRLDTGNEEEGFSSYHSPMIQNHTLQLRAYLMRPFNKSNKPVVKFKDPMSTAYINHTFRYEMDGKQLLRDSAFNGALLKTMATKVYVKPVNHIEEDYAVFEGSDKEEIETEIDLFFADDESIEQVGKTEWEETEVEIEAFEVAPVPAPVAPAPEATDTYLNEDQQALTEELVAPGVEVAEEPFLEEKLMNYKATVRFKKEMIKRKLSIDIIPPYEFHISRQATSQEAAAVVGRVFPMTLSDMKTQFPDAPKLNGFKNKKQAEAFWKDINGEWLGWTQQNEWYTMWLKDNSSYYEGYYFNVAQDADSPAHAYLVADVDIQLDPDNTGYARWYNVVKVGNYILSCDPISQPSFKVGTMVDVAGRWLGLSPAGDLIWDEDTSVTNNMRAADNAILQSTYANPVVDEEQVYLEDVINRRPDSIIRRKNNAVPKNGVAAIEWTATPDVSNNTFNIIEKYQEFAGTANGAGKFFQGHESDNISSSRVTENTARIIENNSDLMLDDVTHRFWDYWRDVLCLAHNAAIIGRADAVDTMVDGEAMTVDPMEHLEMTKVADIDIVVGSNEQSEALEKAQAMLEGIIQLENVPSLANVISPEGKSLAVAAYFKALGVEDEVLQAVIQPQQPNDIMQTPEVQEAIAAAQEEAQAAAQQEIEAFKNSEEMAMKKAESSARVRQIDANIQFQRENAAAGHAYKFELSEQGQQKIDSSKEQFAATQALAEEEFDLEVTNSDREYELAKRPDPVRTEIG